MRAVRPGSLGVSPAASRTTIFATRAGRSSASMNASVPPIELPTTANRGRLRASTKAAMAWRYAVRVRSFPGSGELRPWHGRSGAIQGWRAPITQATRSQTSAQVGHPWSKRTGNPLEALAEDLTPESSFFVRSHFRRPDVPRKQVLEVVGAVQQALRLDIADLQAMGTRTLTATLECAGNGRTGLQPMPAGEPWGLGAVGTARWTGVPLRAVLESARLRPHVVEILAIGADRRRPPDVADEIPFARSLPLAKATDPDPLLALQMNGRPIPPEHGAPIRLIVPGWYGMARGKWLERIEARAEAFPG